MMMKKILAYMMMLATLCGALSGCESIEETYDKYIGDGPIQYLNKIYDLKATPGWESMLLSWSLKLDPGRTGILVEWKNDTNTFAKIIDKDSESFLVEGLTDNYDYEFNVWAITEQDGKVVKKSLGDPVYARSFNYESDELALFTHMVTKQIKVADKKLFVAFDSWPDNLVSFKIGYFEKGSTQESYYEANSNDRINNWPKGAPCAVIGENIDFSKPVNVYRRGKIKSFGNIELDLKPLTLYFDIPILNSDFTNELRPQLGLNGDIKFSDINNISSLNINFNQTSLEDILYFPNLKTLNLGKDRYIMPGTEAVAKSILPSDTKRQLSLVALQLAHDVLGVQINQYSKNYFDVVPTWFAGKNLVPQLPGLHMLDTTGWTIKETPQDAMGYDTGLSNLLVDDNTKYWLPTASTQLREHVFEFDMKQVQNVLGFKVVQANISDTYLQLPSIISIEVMTTSGAWVSATFNKNTTIGNGKGETTLVYLNKDKSTVQTQKIRLVLSDFFYKKGYDANWNYIDFYRTALSKFKIFSE